MNHSEKREASCALIVEIARSGVLRFAGPIPTSRLHIITSPDAITLLGKVARTEPLSQMQLLHVAL